MKQALRCRCGQFQGEVDTKPASSRMRCYCGDCQAYAAFLGRPKGMLDAHGGTEIIATVPRALSFSAGADRLGCMSLSDKGMLRWYAGCCGTPIANTPRDTKLPYIGLVRSGLPGADAAMAEAFGPLKIALNTGSAQGRVEPTRIAAFFGILAIMRNVLGEKLSGRSRNNPFFDTGSGRPVVVPRVLSAEERGALDAPLRSPAPD
jgi:hypothetical protein